MSPKTHLSENALDLQSGNFWKRRSPVASSVGVARKISPNSSQETMTCHSSNCFRQKCCFGSGNKLLVTPLPSICYITPVVVWTFGNGDVTCTVSHPGRKKCFNNELVFQWFHITALKSHHPPWFFLLIPLSRTFLHPNPDPALIF